MSASIREDASIRINTELTMAAAAGDLDTVKRLLDPGNAFVASDEDQIELGGSQSPNHFIREKAG